MSGTLRGLPQHPDIDFGSWAPVRSKAFVQAFADFLVACKKAEKGLLTALRDQAPRSDAGVDAPAVYAQCMASLIPLLPPASVGLQDVEGSGGQELVAGVASAADQTPVVDGATGGTRKRGKGADKRERRKSKRKGRKGTDTEEEEEEIRWDGSDAERNNNPLADKEEDVDQLQSSTDDERRELPFSAKASLKY
ncbi:hypothetical protein B0H14DRAFT_3422075 [Mycena olivaceomarginata]|nr:hypothetical protein B0H14DRAFT_3422075 [Mycena olivaceomarginata]